MQPQALPHLTFAGILFATVVFWWMVASALLRTIEVVRCVRRFLRGE